MTIEKFKSRKFLMACTAFIISTVALFMGIADFSGWSTFVGALMAMYKTSDIVDKKANGGHQ